MPKVLYVLIAFIVLPLQVYSQDAIDAVEFQTEFKSEDFYLGATRSGRNPKGMEFDHKNNYLFVADMWGPTARTASITVMSARTLKVVKNIELPNGYYSKSREHANGLVEVTMTPDNKFALVSRLQGCGSGGCGGVNTEPAERTGTGLLNVIDVKTLEPVMYIPTGGSGSKIIGVKPNSNLVYITNWFTNNVAIVDISKAYSMKPGNPQLHNDALIGTIRFPGGSAPRGVAFNKDGSFMYVMGFDSKTIYVVDTRTNKIFATLPGPGGINFRHMVINRNATIGYFSHMIGAAISRVNLTAFNNILSGLDKSRNTRLSTNVWSQILIPWDTISGVKAIMRLKKYPQDHPEVPGRLYGRASPNTIVLDQSNECYLYVSFRSAGINGGGLRQGKVDVIDVCNDRRIISLISGNGPTALAATANGSLLASSGFFDSTIYFFDIRSIKKAYERMY